MSDKKVDVRAVIYRTLFILLFLICLTISTTLGIYKRIISPMNSEIKYSAGTEFVREALGNKRLFNKGDFKAMSTTPVKNIYDGEYFVSDVSKNGFTLNYTGIPNEEACKRIISMKEAHELLNYKTLNNVNYKDSFYSSEGRESVCKQTDGKPINLIMVF